jgi:DNA-binding transcriptional LysR family regulator
MDWDKLRVFHTVAQCKSLGRAGELLGLSQSAVSRQITGLEERLGIALFHRHARGLMLSEQGDILFRTVSEMVSKLQATENTLAEAATKPKGPFTVTVPSALGTIWVAQILKEFTDLYPDIEVTLLCEDRELDLAAREADAAIRLHPAKDMNLVQKPLMTLHNALYASNDYLRLHAAPKSIGELKHHRIIGFESLGAPPFPEANWLLERKDVRALNLRPYFKVNSLVAMRTAIKQGMGIGAIPEYLMYRARHVSRILPDISGPPTEAYYVYPQELKNSKRVAVFRSFIQQKIAESNF